MRTISRRRWSWPAAGALAVVVGAPSLASAQQGGLFPNAGIRRERVPCQNEDPVYRLYRHEYFGYHPTCWRKFPAGWGCPSPEAPNAAAEFQKLPRDKPPELNPDDPDAPGPDDPGAGPGAMPGPDGSGPLPTPGSGPGRRGAAAPNANTLPPLPSGERSPFDLDTKPITPPPTDIPPASGGNTLPGLPPATDNPPPGADASGPASAIQSRNDQPILALPDPTVDPSANRGGRSAVAGFPLPGGESPLAPPLPTTRPAHTPRRTSFLGNFMNSRMFRR